MAQNPEGIYSTTKTRLNCFVHQAVEFPRRRGRMIFGVAFFTCRGRIFLPRCLQLADGYQYEHRFFGTSSGSGAGTPSPLEADLNKLFDRDRKSVV